MGVKEQASTAVHPKPSLEMPTSPLLPPGDYAESWKIVDSLEQAGLFKSALEQVVAIHERAKKDKNSQQVVKSLLFRGKYTTQLEEDGLALAIQALEAEAVEANQPEKSVLQSILGQLYAAYLQSQSWNLRGRTPIPEGEGGDILTWSAAQIERHALDLYAASVEQDALLAALPMELFRDITFPGSLDSVDNEALRPTLFDLLAHRALEHFTNERNYLTEPSYAFELNQVEAFGSTADFVASKFETRDSTSGKWLAIRLFQKIVAAQLLASGGSKGGALIDAELHRLQFVYNNTTLENKDALFQNALEKLKRDHVGSSGAGEIDFTLANHLYYLESGNKGDNAKTAVSVLERAISRYPHTYGEKMCQQLLRQIRATSISTNVEQINLPNQNILVQLGFRNVRKVWVKVVQGNFDRVKWHALTSEQQFQTINGLPPIQNRTWDIQDPGDFQPHQTEIALEALPLGNYWVLLADNPDFQPKTGTVSYTDFSVSAIAAVTYIEQGLTNFVLADRRSGTPLADVHLDFFRYDYNAGNAVLQKVGSTISNRDGFAKSSIAPNTPAVQVLATMGKDTQWIGTAYNYHYEGSHDRRAQVQFFTDRAIYRPGQTVYFKGLVVRQTQTGSDTRLLPLIVANQLVTVKFYDANGQVKNQVKCKTNEFGTFNASFAAPATGLFGQMSIQADEGAWGQTYFSVEEYKRPRFEVTMKPVEGAFRVNDKITVRGEAKNYAGNAVDGAQVRYRVVRIARLPYWGFAGFWKRPNYNTQTEMEIQNGKTTSASDGSFSIDFTAIPDPATPKKENPIFDFQIWVDVTDITGETRSNSCAVSAGYVALQVDWDLQSEANLDSLYRVGVHTTNMAGQKQPAAGTITMQRLLAPKQFYKDRLWERPDVTTMTKIVFDRMFPDLAWKEEDNPEKWGREVGVRTIAFNTSTTEMVDLHQGQVQPGWYLARLTTQDAFGEKIEMERFVRVWDKNTRFEKPSATVENAVCEPGETAHLIFGGKPEGLHFFCAQERDGDLQKPAWISSQLQGLSTIDVQVGERDRGGIAAHWFTIQNNRIYGVGQLFVQVPWSNKDLVITYESFRDKLAPGQQEEWRINISGPKKDKVAAEMVAALYDASLDQFRTHDWPLLNFPSNNVQVNFGQTQNFGSSSGVVRSVEQPQDVLPTRVYRSLNLFDFPLWDNQRFRMMQERNFAGSGAGMEKMSMVMSAAPAQGANSDSVKFMPPNPEPKNEEKKTSQTAPPAQIRRNLNETVFFFPELRTNAEGDITLKFTMNEALTRWKLLTFAHTKDLQRAVSVKEVVTQKELMIIANPPRFLREGDEIEFAAKVSNLSAEILSGTATLNLLDANTLQPVEREFGLAPNNRIARFSILPGQSGAVSWRVKVPDNFPGAVTWQIYADAKSFRDGEENTIPVVSNRMLVTETLPISVRGNQTKKFVFENLKNSKENSSLETHQYTLEFSSNPAWYAVQALPYLMEFPHECSEQIFSRFYANTLASSVVSKMPQIKRVYERWKGTAAMKSNLSKNQELKYALLEETPWVMDAQNEEQQKQNIALLFDLNRMADERGRAINTLAERQLDSGGWPWFPGGPDSWYITQHIVSGMMHLQKLGAFDPVKDPVSAKMLSRAFGYCDQQIRNQYAKLAEEVRLGRAKFEDDHLDGLAIQYLYARSFTEGDQPKEVGYYLSQASTYWLGKGIYQEGMLALALHRMGDKQAAQKIVASLRERATVKEELGMYWPVDWGYYWYQLPVETQALMVEVFGEVAADTKAVEELRIWLLKNKQTNRWESTKATAEAVYALLLFGDNWLENTKPVQVYLGEKAMKVNEYEPGTGYFKQQWQGSAVKNAWADIKVENPNANIVWGAAYWQYFEDLDKIKDFKKTPLTISKQLFTEENSPTGPILKPIAEGQSLKRGDKIKVRIEIRVDRAMEFVHLKDMRASGFEPLNVLSGYRWQGGLGYYESTQDLATHFFIDYLPRGTFVFEYPLVVSLRGDMSNGITTMQCMYAPEFTSHSKGLRVKVE
jgi:hypothetical protein